MALTARAWARRTSVISSRRPNMRASSWPDMSPLASRIMRPMEKKEVRTTAVPASEASRRDRWPTQVRTAAAATPATAAAGIMASMPR